MSLRGLPPRAAMLQREMLPLCGTFGVVGSVRSATTDGRGNPVAGVTVIWCARIGSVRPRGQRSWLADAR